MRRLFHLSIAALTVVSLAAADRSMRLRLVSEEVPVDGLIEPMWSLADSTSDFFQLQPYYAQPPSRKTVAKVLGTPDALYCLMVCYDTRDHITANTGILDQTSGDIVSIMLDTFNDKQSAYKFAVTASGVRADCRLLDDARNRDYSWDGVWFAESKVYDWGFVVEIKIPYKSLKYNEELTAWGLDFDRWIATDAEDLYWCAYEQSEGQRIAKFGTLELNGFHPESGSMNLEIYPVGISRATYLRAGTYDVDPDAGLDVFYNPSEQLSYLLTVNPDFAQIEADPYSFNITRYETYFAERRPFFTEGNEVFLASGKQRSTGFYSPLELFYSRRIGKILPDGGQIPLIVGTKGYGRVDEWEYGGFMAMTGRQSYREDEHTLTEPRAYFGSVRLKKQILENSSVGVLAVAKVANGNMDGVVDIDGAFRSATWQLAYQLARSVQNGRGDFAASAGFTKFGDHWMTFARTRAIGNGFDVGEVGFVPWKGTLDFTLITGPVWFFDRGTVRQILLYGGPALYYEHADLYTDRAALLGFNMQFRDNWGFELNASFGKSNDADRRYTSYETTLSSWYGITPTWDGNLWGGYSRTFNFNRDYLAFYSWAGFDIAWKLLSTIELGTSYNMYIEGNPEGNIEDITYNARPYLTVSPVNNLRLRVYADNLYARSSDRLERVIIGFLFSYNFLPKSWIYVALNEVHDRSEEVDGTGMTQPLRMHVVGRVGVVKVKYLYYF